MPDRRNFMLDRPHGPGRPSYSAHGALRSLRPGGPARRGPALPAHERRLLLPLGADRSVGREPDGDAGLPLVPRGNAGRCLLEAARRARACCGLAISRSYRRGTGIGCVASPASRRRRSSSSTRERDLGALRDPATRRGRRADAAGLRRGAVRPSGRTATWSDPARDHPDRSAGGPADGVAAEHPAADGGRGARAATRRRSRDHAPRRHPRDPGDPLLDPTDPAARTGWLGAAGRPDRTCDLADPPRSRPRWTVASLAGELAMSRSAFAARFTELAGEPAMQYVTRWRMHVALHALKEDGATVAELANRLGYRSEAAFAARSSASWASRRARSSAGPLSPAAAAPRSRGRGRAAPRA